jgi:hypothetical protein
MVQWISQIKNEYPGLETFPPASPSALEKVKQSLGELPEELEALLKASNGMIYHKFRLFPAYDPANPKKTWESLQRVNDPAKTRALRGDQELLNRFLVFADIGDGYAMFDRTDGSIWYETAAEPEVMQTDLSLQEFVQGMLNEEDAEN